ncbi:TPA: SprT family protein [Streptococcus pyogenes]|uniref:SprT family protein n=1 Tax=Streptococcus pyogenes TaxID=1314 RepID=UPI0010A129AA|nr:SprT family protein [Streptococcus pyogenes]HEP1736869.1 SprT family protein [Streptococcus pyogenes]HEP1745493.1 SprT family protein [Streptococcus pyogenes]HEP1747220.1 SprT family protein [Streptococcus pyogenes]HEP1856047.1 SprT family protein [Streptococcus pyogenes]HEP2045210.1 SprT family protein [Streptococcus pyogenes]
MTLTNYVQEVSLADFGKPFHHKAYWNKRLKTTGGRFFPKDGHLDFNPRMLEEHGELIFRKIVRHELCHYHLYFEGRRYHHKDRDFKDLLAQVNGLRYVPTSSKSKTNHHYSCQTCGQVYQRKRRINLAKYVCGNCHGKLMEKNQS